MLPPPEPSALLFAIAGFLKDGVPTQDPALSFRLRVCAGLLVAIGRGLIGGEAVEQAQLVGLAGALGLPEPQALDGAQRREQLTRLNAELASRIAQGQLDESLDALADGLRMMLASDLQLTNPRFDLRDDIEKGA